MSDCAVVIKGKLETAITSKAEAVEYRNMIIAKEEGKIRQLNREINETKEEIQSVKIYVTQRKAVSEVLNVEKIRLDFKLNELIDVKLNRMETIAKLNDEIDKFLHQIKEIESEVRELT